MSHKSKRIESELPIIL